MNKIAEGCRIIVKKALPARQCYRRDWDRDDIVKSILRAGRPPRREEDRRQCVGGVVIPGTASSTVFRQWRARRAVEDAALAVEARAMAGAVEALFARVP